MIRIATYNVEWFNSLFDDKGRIEATAEWSGRQDVSKAEQVTALGHVFQAMNADVIMVIEAPDISRSRDGTQALRNFADHFGLRTRAVLAGFANETQQEILLMYDPDRVQAKHDPKGTPTGKKGKTATPRFDGVFRWDLDTDAAPEPITWSKPPLEVALRTKGGRALRLIGVHAKSKAPHGARTPAEILRVNIENRRKQLAQCIWLRQRVEQHLEAKEDLIVLGDFNDGPGLDEYEKLFGRSSIEIVMGEEGAIQLYDPHARLALSKRVPPLPTTSRFRIPPDGHFLAALLDYIMVSPGLAALDPVWRIWHPFDDPACFADDVLRESLLLASDHFPVTLDIKL